MRIDMTGAIRPFDPVRASRLGKRGNGRRAMWLRTRCSRRDAPLLTASAGVSIDFLFLRIWNVGYSGRVDAGPRWWRRAMRFGVNC